MAEEATLNATWERMLAAAEARAEAAERQRDYLSKEHAELVPQLEAAEARVGQLEAERQAVIDCLNLYGDATVHNALDNAGLLRDEMKGKGQD